MIDNEEAVLKELEVFHDFLQTCESYEQILNSKKWGYLVDKYIQIIAEKKDIKKYLVRDITRRVQQY